MHQIVRMESGTPGVLMVNGCFCGPLDAQGQAFPAGSQAEIYIQLFPFSSDMHPLTAVMELQAGRIVRLEPQAQCYALIWPDGVIQLELRPEPYGEAAQTDEKKPPFPEERAAANVLLRYLTGRLTGDARAAQLLMRPQETPELPDYDAVAPLRFAPMQANVRFDQRAGLVRRMAPNVAVVDAALAMTSPAGQGHALIERIEVMPTLR